MSNLGNEPAHSQELKSDQMWSIIDQAADADSIPAWVAKSVLSDLRARLLAAELAKENDHE